MLFTSKATRGAGKFTVVASRGTRFTGSAACITSQALLFTSSARRGSSNFTLGASRDARVTSNELSRFSSLFCLKNKVYAVVKAVFC